MTPRAAALTVLAAMAASLLSLMAGQAVLNAASRRAAAAEHTFDSVKRDAAQVVSLRATSQTVAAGEQPPNDVFRRANETLTACGITSVRVQSVSPAGHRAVSEGDGGPSAQRVQAVRIVLDPIRLQELGSFLERWRRDQALWLVSSIELSSSKPGSDSGGSYRATLTASALYFDGPVSTDRSGDDPAPLSDTP